MDFNKEFKNFAVKDRRINSMHLEDYQKTQQTPFYENMTRSVIEERQAQFREVDVFSRLMMDRIIFMGMEINDMVSNVVIAQLLFLESVDPKRDVQIFINSPGGSIIAGLAIYDTMQYVSPDIATINTGLAASMGSILLTAGAAGKRSGLKHSRVMIHQPMGGMRGQFSDMEISYNLVREMQKQLYNIYVEHTGQPYDKVAQDCDRDNWMTAEQAMEYRLIDEVLTGKPKKSAE
jgi:ATP-dependent Clp protease, protease subunit